VLLIRRGQPPGQGLLALPGGFLDPHESLWHACLRELAEETGLQASTAQWRAALQASQVFDHPERSQRGRTLTYAHYFELPGTLAPVQAADDAADARWWPKAQLGALEDQFHDDHFHILSHFLGLTN
jgi:bifunctional NMN adenylyltransferase/nudix hydrolase